MDIPNDDMNIAKDPGARPLTGEGHHQKILHFSDGILEECLTEEDEKKLEADQEIVDPRAMMWVPWLWYQTSQVGSKVLQICDRAGESLADFFGITSPKYQYEIDEHNKRCEQEREEKMKMDLEYGGWTKGSEQVNSSNCFPLEGLKGSSQSTNSGCVADSSARY